MSFVQDIFSSVFSAVGLAPKAPKPAPLPTTPTVEDLAKKQNDEYQKQQVAMRGGMASTLLSGQSPGLKASKVLLGA